MDFWGKAGVWIPGRLKCNNHCEVVCLEDFNALGMLDHIFMWFTRETMSMVVNTYIVSLMDTAYKFGVPG